MSNFANYDLTTGRVVQTYSLADGEPPADIDGTGVIEPPESLLVDPTYPRDWKVVDGVFVNSPIPPQPSEHENFWNEDTQQWEDPRDIEDLRAAKAAEIDAERDRRLTVDEMEYDGMLLDANAGAKQNLQDKITAVTSRIEKGTPTPPQMLVWRDRTGVVHSWPTLQAYKDWLNGYVIALENRGMQAWGWSWAKKDALAALTTKQEIVDFDATS
jgi:hypothetical protein